MVMWGKLVYKEIVPLEKLVYVQCFSDEKGGVTRHPLAPTWPLEMLTEIRFTEEGQKTKVTLSWTPYNASDEENATFDGARGGMEQGWGGSFKVLDAYLSRMARIEIRGDRGMFTTRDYEASVEKLFQAWSEPERIARWWGPDGFINRIEEFDFRPGGHWRFAMVGPDGTSYPNHIVFQEIEAPKKIVLLHSSNPQFTITAEFSDLGGGRSRMTWKSEFKTAADFNNVKGFAVEGNRQNFERLADHLAGKL
jgi:uncharacterized protein YndB with AHSA1/START domain